MGFSHTHLSGTGCGDLLDFPGHGGRGAGQAGARVAIEAGGGISVAVSHADEVMERGYYSVMLQDLKVRVELTSTERTGLQRYTFPESKEAWLIIAGVEGLH